MNRINSILIILLALAISFLHSGCSEDADGGDITIFEGTFAGKYRALLFDTPSDTVVVTVDAATNKVTISSRILNTSFEADYNPSTERAEINNLTIDTLKFVLGAAVNFAYNTTVPSGFCEMRKNDTELYISLNSATVGSHTFDPPVPTQLPPVDVTTPNNMKPL